MHLDVDQDRDVDADDFRGGIPITWGDSIYQVKFTIISVRIWATNI